MYNQKKSSLIQLIIQCFSIHYVTMPTKRGNVDTNYTLAITKQNQQVTGSLKGVNYYIVLFSGIANV